ncbi:MAG: exodeoxyribonuclease V subunit gamma [Pseudoxanthomonas suwonensis]|nr:exodeoxyribonuclease V subunit gamma [Pseudoxanthomonas suwonensis]
MQPSPDFRLYQSNALEVLAGLLADALRTPASEQAPLAPDIVLIPQVAMKRWLQATLAARHGIAANLEFLAPGEFVRRVLDANVPGAAEDLDAAALRWRLYAALGEPALLKQPAMARIRRYLDAGDALHAWSLAGELASVFEKYQAWRRDWLLRWEAGAEPDDPQAVLWRTVAGGRQHRARRIQGYLDGFAGDGKPLPQGLPSRLFAFAIQNISPDVLRVIATQARGGTLHFFVPSPSERYWGDLERLRAAQPADSADPFDAAAGDSRLLQAWGSAGRDFMALLGGYEVVHPRLDVGAWPDPLEAGGALADGLLRRMQHDILQRRATAPGIADVRVDDPTLQVHACHTRLRELQVLHDQLRGLLEDPRFDPPLQPRQIAVLAPDIDPYVPYLEAVFGGDAGQRLPWTVADTSPLQGEPLAEVFLQVLQLPVSRFGLSELLALMGSPPLATASGLDEADFDRLRAWLQAAGVRWGLDAAHRQSQDAPADDTWTWQFALDRLLLGHATGSDADTAGVAPRPELEGGALSALDALLQRLREFAGWQRRLGDAHTPTQWRALLLGVLETLLPEPPADAGSRRALERLRSLVNEFVVQAQAAGFDAPVPADVVRAHFAATLGEADTRAPLLTGGISFGRMVPMRLLPFRVICVLGMNDGDFPRRDPAAGLSRSTAAIGTDARRRGDRSVREDDRFLFLQLFTAAQDVFYVSYLGADARDGSMREPSVLVSELLEEAARQHADPDAARRRLVVRHPLQPFSPQAFGGDDRRRFSYRRQWQAAAEGASSPRRVLAPWFDSAPLAEAATPAAAIRLDALRRVLETPASAFLQHTLGLRMDVVEDAGEDIEPLAGPQGGIDRAILQRALFPALVDGMDEDTLHQRLRARGLLPAAALGRTLLARERQRLEPYVQAFRDWRGEATAEARRIVLPLGDRTVHAQLGDIYPHGIARLRFGKRNGPSVIRSGLDWLVACAHGLQLPLVAFHEDALPPTPREPLEPAQARAALEHLLSIHDRAFREPLPFAARSGWAYHAEPKARVGVRKALGQWRGGTHVWAEGGTDVMRLALRGRDPFVDPASLQRFIGLAVAIFAALEGGAVVDPDSVELPDIGDFSFDAEEDAG